MILVTMQYLVCGPCNVSNRGSSEFRSPAIHPRTLNVFWVLAWQFLLEVLRAYIKQYKFRWSLIEAYGRRIFTITMKSTSSVICVNILLNTQRHEI